MNRNITKWIVSLLCLTFLLLITIVISLSVGSVQVPVERILEIICNDKSSIEYNIIFNLRLPRIILGLAVGGSLSLAGLILQGLFRNPLVEPYTLGISGGAALAVSLDLVLRLNYIWSIFTLPVAGFIGSMSVILLIYIISLKGGILRMQTLLLTGVMISFISSSIIMLIMTITKTEELHSLIFWITGTLQETNWTIVKVVFTLSIFGLITSYFFCHDLNALLLGEEGARSLGINVERSKKLLFIIASVLTGISVSFCGIIGFVGLIVPHILRNVIGVDHRILLMSSFLTGALFLVICDTLSRTIISPLELPVGVITGIIGGVFFISLAARKDLVGY